MDNELLVEMRGHALWLTINRESRRNAITRGVIEGLSQALDRAEADRSVRAVVITGAGDKAFCAGADLRDGDMFAANHAEPYGKGALLFRKARNATVPLIARVNGVCVAGGMGFLAMCDLAVAATHATFGLPEVKVGLFPAQVVSVLQGLLPRRVLTELCLTGASFSAARALELGLVNHVGDDVDAVLDPLLAGLAEVSPSAVRRGLYMLKKTQDMPFEQSISFTESQIALFSLTEDAKEGQLAFQEKRKPVWTGR